MTRGPSTGRLDRAEPLANPARSNEKDAMRSRCTSLVIAILIGSLVTGTPVGVVAQDDTGFIPMIGRVERPDDGYAITLPHGWIAQDLSTEVHWALYGGPHAMGQTPYLYAQRTDIGATCGLFEFTEFALVPPTFGSLDEAASALTDHGEEVHFLETPAGEVACVVGVDSQGWTNETYIYHLADRWFMLECFAPRAEEELWSLARSFEFIPAE